ncbi:hypothetical protein MMC16_001715 [Acarospora aff. strigata]|nr:hypothetical protein [Acarospora aff. strigata]
MSFRKRNLGLSSSSSPARTPTPPTNNSAVDLNSPISPPPHTKPSPPTSTPGIRPSPLDGRPTTSTGTPSLDALLAGHAGLALGTSLLIEESGTTDYAGTLLRYYAAEGVVQGHVVHVVGVGEGWGRELPGVVGEAEQWGDGKGAKGRGAGGEKRERMKIAWRYERLGEFGAARGTPPIPDRNPLPSAASTNLLSPSTPTSFCHTFDLAKRLTLPADSSINFIPVPAATSSTSPFTHILQNLINRISSSPQTKVHRLVLPSLLSPALYPPNASEPQHILQFLHGLRSLLRQYPMQLTAMSTLPLSLYPRSTGLVRWAEILSDGVLELAPFPHSSEVGSSTSTSGAATAQEEQPQGMLKIRKLPIFHERGGGGVVAGLGDDLAFTVSRRKFVIKPFSLPPVEGDTEAQRGEGDTKPTKVDIAF